MSDQQRLLLAAVLMSLVLLAGWMFGSNRRSPEDRQQVVPPAADTASAVVDTIIVQDPVIDGTSLQADSAGQEPDPGQPPARTMTVIIPGEDGETLVIAGISTQGGSIESWVLPGWRNMSMQDGGGDPVDLAVSPWFTAVDSSGTTVFGCSSPDTVRVGESTRIVLETAGGRTRTYTFRSGSYAFDVADGGAGGFTVAEGAIPVTETDVVPNNYFSAAWFAEKHRSKKTKDLDEPVALGRVLWVASRTRYFTVLLMSGADERQDGAAFSTDDSLSPGITLSDDSITVYAGPVDYDRLHALGSRTDSLVDFGWPLIRWIGQLIYLFISRVLGFVSNWGLRIVILSVVLKLSLMPLSIHSSRSMRKMQSMQPLVQELQKKYANDPMRQRQELSKLYKENGVNPIGGCVPLLLQMPVFFALYRVLENSVGLRGAGFFLWITDLSRPEILIPFGSRILGLAGIGLLPLLMGVAMFFQQKMTVTDPSQKSMTYMMPVIMTWLFMRFPAGLSVYWFVNNVLSIAEQKLVRRSAPAATAGKPAK